MAPLTAASPWPVKSRSVRTTSLRPSWATRSGGLHTRPGAPTARAPSALIHTAEGRGDLRLEGEGRPKDGRRGHRHKGTRHSQIQQLCSPATWCFSASSRGRAHPVRRGRLRERWWGEHARTRVSRAPASGALPGRPGLPEELPGASGEPVMEARLLHPG